MNTNLYERIEEQREALSLLVAEVGGDFLHPRVLAASEALDKLLIAAYRPPGPTVQPILQQASYFPTCDHQRKDGQGAAAATPSRHVVAHRDYAAG